MIPLLDKEFLKQLDQYKHKTVYAKIISLNNYEQPIEKIEGVVTGGSISIDGSSSIRRSCNLTLTANNLRINNVYWGITNKISLEIGLENNIDKRYDKIIWFPQGIYILTDFKTSHQVNNYTISLSGKDKMCLLNGDVSGTFNAETDLGIEYNKLENGDIIEREVPIREIILEMIRHYAKEPFSNIIIKDLEPFGLQMLENKSSIYTYYLIYTVLDNKLIGIYTQESEEIISCPGYPGIKNIRDIQKYDDKLNFFYTVEEDSGTLITSYVNFTKFVFKGAFVYVQKVDYGNTIGYTPVDLVYSGDLIASVGDSVTSILDKIVKMLGDFEYFYNLKGQFVFQKKQTYINSDWNNIIQTKSESYVSPAMLSNKVSYFFDNSTLITSFQNNPKLENIKNDFTVWGIKKTADGAEVPIHARYAIDVKPLYYMSFDLISASTGKVQREKTFYTTYTQSELPNNIQLPSGIPIRTVDWREIIYQMALDYYRYYHTDEYENMLRRNNQFFKDNSSAYPFGETGYEQYYHDIEGFWRLLYLGYDNIPEDIDLDKYYDENDSYPLWHKDVILSPSSLLFWFDFFDGETSDIGKFSVQAIGDRSKNIKNDQIRAIIYPDTPDVVYVTEELDDAALAQFQDGYIIYSDVDKAIVEQMSISARRRTIHDEIDSMLYNYSYFNNSITLNSIPIYYLEPNTIISVNDERSNISGFFSINKFTIPLTYNGTMSITAVEIPQKIY